MVACEGRWRRAARGGAVARNERRGGAVAGNERRGGAIAGEVGMGVRGEI